MAAILATVHLTLHVGLGLGGGAPDLLTLAMLLLALETSPPAAGFLGMALGLTRDALAISGFGAGSLAGAIVATLGSFSREMVIQRSASFFAFYFLIGKWLFDALSRIFGGGDRSFLEAAVIDGGIGAVYLAAVGLAIVLLAGLFQKGEAK